MNPEKRLRTGGGGGAETPRGEREEAGREVDVSIVMPVHNASCWLDECLQAISEQDFTGSMELSVYDDASTDDSGKAVEGWRTRMEARGISVVISGHSSAQPKGVGYAKNMAISQSCGKYLCFQDADDIMSPHRVRLQYEASLLNPNALIGCRVQRLPEGSTERYTRWINTITQEQLMTQVFTSHGPTVVMPTWFCSRNWFLKVEPFDEGGKGVPEDLIFFYQSLRQGGGLSRVNQCLLVYRYHEKAATHSVTDLLRLHCLSPESVTELELTACTNHYGPPPHYNIQGGHVIGARRISEGYTVIEKTQIRMRLETIWMLRVDFLQERVLSQWSGFTIWNAGKQGRKLYRCLSPANRKKVKAFCDVDENKIQKGFYTYEESKEIPKPKIPIVHYKAASAPFIVCVKLDMTGGVLEENLNSLQLKEGTDYYHFN